MKIFSNEKRKTNYLMKITALIFIICSLIFRTRNLLINSIGILFLIFYSMDSFLYLKEKNNFKLTGELFLHIAILVVIIMLY